MASKDFYTQLPSNMNSDLYWPSKPDKIDMLKLDIVKFVPISDAGTGIPSSLTGTPQPQEGSFASGTQLKTAKTKFATVLLPVPEGITYADSPQWQEERIGAVGKLAGILAKQFAEGGGGSGETIQKLAAAGLGPYVLQNISKFGPGGLTGEAITQGASGVVLNPYVEQIFKGIGMRNFSFNWKLVPRNKEEQVRIHNIIRALRYYSLPNYTATTGLTGDENAPAELTNLQDRWLTVPNIFEPKWVYQSENKEIKSLPSIKPCVLKGVTVNYTPDGVWATHMTNDNSILPGPAPVAYNLSLEFSETEIITSSEVQKGY